MYFELEVVIAKVRLFVEFTGKGKKQKYLKTFGFPKLYIYIYIYMIFTSHIKMKKKKKNNNNMISNR